MIKGVESSLTTRPYDMSISLSVQAVQLHDELHKLRMKAHVAELVRQGGVTTARAQQQVDSKSQFLLSTVPLAALAASAQSGSWATQQPSFDFDALFAVEAAHHRSESTMYDEKGKRAFMTVTYASIRPMSPLEE